MHRHWIFAEEIWSQKGWRTSQPRTFQPQASTPDLSTPDFSTMNFSTPDFSTINFWTMGLKSSWLKSLGLTSPGLQCPSTKKKASWKKEKALFPWLLPTRNHYRFLFDKSWRKGMSLTSAVLTLRSSTARHSTGSRFRLGLEFRELVFHVANFNIIIFSFRKMTLWFVSCFLQSSDVSDWVVLKLWRIWLFTCLLSYLLGKFEFEFEIWIWKWIG